MPAANSGPLPGDALSSESDHRDIKHTRPDIASIRAVVGSDTLCFAIASLPFIVHLNRVMHCLPIWQVQPGST